LRSLKAYILEDLETGELYYAGPVCAENKAGKDALTGAPDLTKFTMTMGESERGGSGGPGGNAVTEFAVKRAIEYLILREDKLVDELNCSYQVLKDYYDRYSMGELSESDARHINNIASKAPDSLTPAALQKIYNYLFWLDVAIQKLDKEKTDFLVGVRNSIASRGKVTENQKNGINKWLINIDGVPQVK
jgi:hypothetical protein